MFFPSCIIYFLDHESEALPLPFCELSLLEDPSLNCEITCDDAPVSVKGRLRKSLQFWKDIDAPRFIIDTIEFGYKLPLLQIPAPFVARNNNSAIQDPVLLRMLLMSLLVWIVSPKFLHLLL